MILRGKKVNRMNACIREFAICVLGEVAALLQRQSRVSDYAPSSSSAR